jgi:dTDP-4-amino-4,6-dideoxygalactose transaminase
MERVPLVDLRIQHEQIKDEINEGFSKVLENTSFILGPAVKEFEKSYAAFAGVKHCLGVGSGTDALELMLRALGVGPGDEVIVPTNSFIATALAVARTGAKPVLVDCDERYHLIDPNQVEAAINRHTQAVIPVHLFGQMAPMAELRSITERTGVALLEDAAQSQGARQASVSSGAAGLAGATSFFPGKNLGAYGDAGAVTTNSDAIASAIVALRNYGSEKKYHHPCVGFNSRLDSMQAVVLNAKLKRLARWNEERRAAAKRYDTLLAKLDWLKTPGTLPGNEHVWHIYAVRVPQRDRVLAALHESGIDAGIHYPVPIHSSGAFADLGFAPGSFPVAERLASEMLSLPLFPGITMQQQERVANTLARIGTLVAA